MAQGEIYIALIALLIVLELMDLECMSNVNSPSRIRAEMDDMPMTTNRPLCGAPARARSSDVIREVKT